MSTFLTPIDPSLSPPRHTQMEVRCFTCSKFPVCNIRKDYLKTVSLIQKILGDPSEDYLLEEKPIHIPHYHGTPIKDSSLYFPNEVAANTLIKPEDELTGIFSSAKFKDIDNLQFVYNFNGYYVIFSAKYDTSEALYVISQGRDIYYKIKYQINETSLDELQLGLLDWRKFKEENTDVPDVINTTFFTAKVDCHHYEWIKNLSYSDGLKRMIIQFPEGIPIDEEGTLFHLATYHYEPNQIELPHISPFPYPYGKRCSPSFTRNQLNGE